MADIGDWLEGVTVTAVSLVEMPPINCSVTEMNPDPSEPR